MAGLALAHRILLGPLGLDVGEAVKDAHVGGQAVIEGVMMRGPARWTVTVRRADGALERLTTDYRGWAKKVPLLGKPFLRGALVLLESMIVGVKALNFSAEIATADEQKASASQMEPPPTEAKEPKAKPWGFLSLALTLLAAFGLAMLLFVALPHAGSVLLGQVMGFDESSAFFHILDGGLKFGLFISYVWAIGLIPEIDRVYAYHGAEHQAIHTFEAGEPLTAEKAAHHPVCHPRCGTAFIFLVLALSILVFAAIFPFFFTPQGASLSRTILGILLKIALMLPLAGLAYEVTRLAGQASSKSIWRILLWPGLLLQRLTTRRPDRPQLEVALNALEQAVAPA
ncbi:MAG: DUF1385 domain-containing protein [Candidatus Adiutrix sp.]|jgi:uncharacterized protein YqhQ|nr:DUF1385 domain-containing protein [Candidatus Adiutrix sp.]